MCDPVYDALRVDDIILLVSEYKSYSSCSSPSFSETYEDNALARKIAQSNKRI